MRQRELLAKRLGISQRKAGTLLAFVNRAAQAQEIEHNTGRDSSRHVILVESYAKELGFGIMWPGLYPVLLKDGQQIHLE